MKTIISVQQGCLIKLRFFVSKTDRVLITLLLSSFRFQQQSQNYWRNSSFAGDILGILGLNWKLQWTSNNVVDHWIDNLNFVLLPVWLREHCRISPSHFLVECHKSNWIRVVLFCWMLCCLLYLSCICGCVFSCTVLFVKQVIDYEDLLQNHLDFVDWGVKHYSKLNFV